MTSIRRDLTTRLLAGLWALVLVGGLGLYIGVRAVLTRHFDETLDARGAGLVSAMHWNGTGVDVDITADTMPWYSLKGSEYFEVRHAGEQGPADEAPVAASDSLRGRPWRLKPRAASGAVDVTLPDGRPGRAMVTEFRPSPDEDPGEPEKAPHDVLVRTTPRLLLVVSKGRDELDRALSVLAAALLAAGAAMSGGAYLVVGTALARGLRPLSRLSSQVQGIGADSLSRGIDASGAPAELGPVYDRLNNLLLRLQSAFDRERAFTLGAAHELRTPLAELRSLVEVSRSRERTAAESAAALDEALSITIRMSKLVEGLFWLARRSGGTATGAPDSIEAVDVAPILRAVAARHAPGAKGRGGEIVVEAPDGRPAMANAALLESVLDNVLANAVAHAAPLPRVRCELTASSDAIVVSVSNPAQGVRAEDAERFFEPFWRGSESRTDRAHLGLGLTLARAACEATGGRMTAEVTKAGEVLVRVWLAR